MTDDRPFYELDDDELIIEEAADAALSQVVSQAPAHARIAPALPLATQLDSGQAQAMSERYARKNTLTILDHAYIVNRLASKHTVEGKDAYGFAAALNAECGLLLLDAAGTRHGSRSTEVPFPHTGVTAFVNTPLDYTGKAAAGLGTRFVRNDLAHFSSNFVNGTPFFALRRFSLALMPTAGPNEALVSAVLAYTAAVRVVFNGAAAKEAILPWERLAELTDGKAEKYARSVLALLGKENIAS